jgi:hypothetical protein
LDIQNRGLEYRAAVMEMASKKSHRRTDQTRPEWLDPRRKSGYLIEAAKRHLELSGSGKKLVTER